MAIGTGGKFTIYQSIPLYRKFTADHIFTGHEILSGTHVLVTDESGEVTDIVEKNTAGEDVEVFKGMLCPGFINCHCHLELSHMKGLVPKHTGLIDFVLKVVNERHFDDAQILEAIEQGENELLQNGIVAVGDICNNTFTVSQKAKGRLQYHNFIEASGFPPAAASMRFQRAKDLHDSYAGALPANSIVPHAPYSVSPEMFGMINEYPDNGILTIHNQEIPAENELFENGSGDLLRLYEKMGIDISFFKPSHRSSLQTWLPYFTKEQPIILVHNIATSAADIEFAKQQTANNKQQTFFCLCPNANLYISNKLPDIKTFTDHHCDIVLGTDSLASNDQLSILEEIKTLRKNFPDSSLLNLLQAATINGARALQVDDALGSFEKGKKPGIVQINAMDGSNITDHSTAIRIL